MTSKRTTAEAVVAEDTTTDAAPGTAEETPTQATTTPEEALVRSRLYTKATSILRDENQPRFREILQGLYEEKGLTYRRQQTQAEKDEAALQAILAANPGLRDKYLAQQGEPVPSPESDGLDEFRG